ncbi:MAG: hypothetical protein KDA92_17645 [Planctomycetales bacterium]|nr:hypothetical protein [Planctomycetales bacterium]
MNNESAITRYLRSRPSLVLAQYATATAFTVYFCMYAFRKPFTAVSYEGYMFGTGDVTLKTALATSQILGYALSKVIGIRFCSEITRARRFAAIVGLVTLAELALLLFAILPPNLKIIAMFLNGLPLGMIWGLVVLYLEGRKTSELLLAGLSCSFILSSGFVKSAGSALMERFQLPEFWMPVATGAAFYPLFLLSTYLLDQVPQPDAEDVAMRVERKTMTRTDRFAFFRQFAFGMTLLLIVYFVLTAYRDFRDNFAAEIFKQLGYGGKPAVFAKSETYVAFAVMVPIAALNFVRNNRRGLFGAFAIMCTGCLMLAAGTWALDRQLISGLTWMVLVGTGAYLTYVPYNSVLFDRLIASTRATGTAVFAINLADSFGYAGSIGVMLVKDATFGRVTQLDFLRYLSYGMAGLGFVLLVISCIYFMLWHTHHDE